MSDTCDRCHQSRKSYPACHTQVTVDKDTGHPVKVTISTFKEWQHDRKSCYLCDECLLEIILDSFIKILEGYPDWKYPKDNK